MKRIPLYIIAMLSLVSCEKELEFNGDEVKPQLVLYSFINAGDSVSVDLTNSRFILSDIDIRTVTDATVTLWKDGSQIETLEYLTDVTGYTRSCYAGKYVVQEGDELTVKASAPGYDEISCYTKIPLHPAVVSVDNSAVYFKSSPLHDYYGGTGDTIGWCIDEEYNTVCRIADPGDRANYYRIIVGIKWIYEDGDERYKDIEIESKDIVFGMSATIGLGEGLETEKNRYNIFSDEYFNGNSYGVKFNWRYMHCGEKDYTGSAPSKVIRRELHVALQEISRDYYLYVKTLLAAEDNDGSPFSEPVQIYSNVTGGIGVLCSTSTTVHKTVLRLN